MGPKYITVVDLGDKLEQEAYSWAVNELKRMGCNAEPLSVTFGSDCHYKDKEGDCIYSIFHNCETNHTLLRRDWFNDMSVVYDTLINFEEVKTASPKSVAHMLKNGIKLYQFYDGPTGGITREMDKKWLYA